MFLNLFYFGFVDMSTTYSKLNSLINAKNKLYLDLYHSCQ